MITWSVKPLDLAGIRAPVRLSDKTFPHPQNPCLQSCHPTADTPERVAGEAGSVPEESGGNARRLLRRGRKWFPSRSHMSWPTRGVPVWHRGYDRRGPGQGRECRLHPALAHCPASAPMCSGPGKGAGSRRETAVAAKRHRTGRREASHTSFNEAPCGAPSDPGWSGQLIGVNPRMREASRGFWRRRKERPWRTRRARTARSTGRPLPNRPCDAPQRSSRN
jgi:hypothetical protein